VLIDACAHPGTDDGLASLIPYMDDAWAARFRGLGLDKSPAFQGASAEDLLNSDIAGEAAPAGVLLVPRDALNAWPDRSLATTLIAAANDYFVSEWLPRSDRFRLAALICGQDPVWSAAEIERLASDPRIVAAAIAPMHALLGNRHYDPIFEACRVHDLPLVVFPSGAEGRFTGAPQTAGSPLSEFERRVVLPQVAQGHIASLVFDGTFERFPSLKVMFAGFGFSWLTPLLWRMDMDWRRTRIETPWVKHLPSDYVRQHIRLTTSPSDAPTNPDDLASCLEYGYAEDVLLYASDRPTIDDNSASLLDGLSPEARLRVGSQGAAEFMREPNLS
jgi:predicted TIM-barrel fold metal-dependent hydrolase